MSRQYASEDERSGSLESSYDEYDDEFYGNEDDRAYLYSLPDVERESILYERSEQRKEREERRRIRRQARGERDVPRSAPKKPERSRREVVIQKSGEQKRKELLEEMKDRRAQVGKNTKAARTQREDDGEYYDSDHDDGKYRKVEDEEFNKRPQATQRTVRKEELFKIVISRSKLEKWYNEPYFAKTVVGLFVKVSYSSHPTTRQYRLCEILGLEDTNSAYQFGKHKNCNQLLLLKPNDHIKKFELRYVSNEEPTDEEFAVWLDTANKHGEVLEDREIKELQEKVRAADDYIYTEEDIQRNIERNRMKNPNAVNLNLEKARVLQLLKDEEEGDNSEAIIRDLNEQLAEIVRKETERANQQNKGKVNIADVNRRSIKENNLKMEKSRGQKADPAFDEFKRRETRPQLGWLEKSSEKKRPAEPQPQQEAQKRQKTEPGKQKIQGSLDNFDIDVEELYPSQTAKRQTTLKPITSSRTTIAAPGVRTMSFTEWQKSKQK